MLSRLDHVAIAVHHVDRAIPYYRDTLELSLVGDEIADDPGVRLVYFDAGNAFLQLVEPVRADVPVSRFLHHHGEGLHHVCFATDDLAATATALDGTSRPGLFRGGRDRLACFLSEQPNGVRIELTEVLPSRSAPR